jgi:hypothetical protein
MKNMKITLKGCDIFAAQKTSFFKRTKKIRFIGRGLSEEITQKGDVRMSSGLGDPLRGP